MTEFSAVPAYNPDLLDPDDATANRLLADISAQLAIPGEVSKPSVTTGISSIPAPVTAPSGPTVQTMIETELRAVQTATAIARDHDALREAIAMRRE